jgi:hypothetical protein
MAVRRSPMHSPLATTAASKSPLQPSRLASFVALLLGTALIASPLAVHAQFSDSSSRVRAINLARNKAVQLNGGLTIYNPAACMFNTDQGGGDCLVRSDAEGLVFRFPGGVPGWQQSNTPATVETEIKVSPDGRTVLEVLYNGTPR